MNPYYYIISINGLLFIFSIVFYLFPPKKISSIYGYRTPKTMKNETVWKFANALFVQQFFKYSAISFMMTLLFVYLFKHVSWQPMAIMLISLAVSVIKTEIEIGKKFDDNGNQK